MRHRYSPALFVALPLVLLAGTGALFAQPAPPTCLPGTQQSFAATGSVQTFVVPPTATAVYIVAESASGGTGGTAPFLGGLGAHIAAEVPVTGGTTLSVVVGGTGGTSGVGGGGGGGSFVYSGSSLLVAAGGGGGGSITENGSPAELSTSGSAGGGASGGAGGTGGGGGGGGTGAIGLGGSGGGGGSLGAGSDGFGSDNGLGGHQISSPGDAAGAGTNASGGGTGGFGGGGGGSLTSGGGGGGYSGGGGAYGGGFDGGGGGGSFVATSGTTYESYVLSASGDGSVTICVTQMQNIPTLAPWGLAALALVLLLAGALVIARRP